MQQPEVVRFGSIEIDHRCLPVAIIRYHDGQTGDDFARMAHEVARIAEERRFIGMIHDTTRLTSVLGATDRKAMREAIDHLLPTMDEKAVGAAVIIRNPIVRGAMTAAKWFMEQQYPEEVFATPREGAEWLVLRFEEAGQPLPAATAERLLRLAEARPAA